MKEIIVKAPATIANFGPGFDIFALALEEPYDELKVSLTGSNSISLTVSGRPIEIPTSVKENSAGLAALRFFEQINFFQGVEIQIRKRMRIGSGLGSTGASAAACVYALNKLFNANLEDNKIIEIASEGEIASGGIAHADNVAACLLGGFILVKNFNPLEVVRIDVPDIPIVMCIMKKALRTTRGRIAQSYSLVQIKEQMSYCANLIQALMRGDLKGIGEAVNKDHISEPARATVISGYDEIKKKVLAAGAYGCNISGGGSSIFAICEEQKRTELGELMSTHFRQRGVEHEIIITKASNTGIVEISKS
ncbi:MAG: homoserine kinase [candidate division KSB1 bacterium]|nr:homoserine kinase [candidate division KSB1 bacterium]